MDVDALSKGKSKGKGKKEKGQNHVSKCWNCGKTGHYARNCIEMWWSRGKGKGKARGYEHADGCSWVKCVLMGCGNRQTGRKERTGSGWCTTATDCTPWESEEAVDGIEFNSIEECCNENPRRGEKQETSEGDGRRRGTPAHELSPTLKPTWDE